MGDEFVTVRNYNLYRQDRGTITPGNQIKKGWGICFFEQLTIQNVQTIFVTAVYRPPSGSTDAFKKHIYELLNVITLPRKADISLVGDFNID